MSGPILSVLVTLGPRRDRAATVAAAVSAQTAVDRLELLLLDCTPELGLPEPASRITTKVVRCAGESRLGAARAAGFERSRGELVAFLADHVIPDPGWAEALISAYGSGSWAAIGYTFRNANPGTYGSRAAMLADFGPWLEPSPTGMTASLPPNDVSYRRSALTGLDGDLAEWLTAEPLLLEELSSRGERFALAGDARVSHGCLRTMRANGLASFEYCRALAALESRRRAWRRPRRLLQAILTGLGAPPLRVANALRGLTARSMLRDALSALPGIAVQHLYAGAGQAWGYLTGAAGASQRFLFWETAAPRHDP